MTKDLARDWNLVQRTECQKFSDGQLTQTER